MTSLTHSTTWSRSAAAGALVLGLAVGLFNTAPSGITHTIDTTWAFDLASETAVAGYADFVIDGTVEDIVTSGDGYTVFSVRIDREHKGALPRTVLVQQVGFTDADGVHYETDDQPLLVVGDQYTLALTANRALDGNVLSLIAGPIAATTSSSATATALVEAEDGAFPSTFLPDFEARRARAGADWAASRPSFQPGGSTD